MKRWGIALALCALLGMIAVPAQAELAFEQSGYDPFTNGTYSVLSHGTLNGLRFEQANSSCYMVSDGQSTLRWNAEGICEEGFQSFAMPGSLTDVREMNRVMAYLNDEPCAQWRDRNAFMEDGLSAVRLWEIPLTLTLREDAAFTDDPYGSCRELKALSAGDSVTCLGYFDALWALAQTQIDGGMVRGFVPLRALAAPQEEPLDDVAAHLAGRWLFFSGSEMLGMAVEFCDDGTLIPYTYEDWDAEDRALIPEGKAIPYAVYAAPEGRYAEGVRYVLELTYADGAVARYGLELSVEEQFGGEGLGLRKGYGGGGYYREGQTPRLETGDWG